VEESYPFWCTQRAASLHFFGRVDGGLIRIIVWATHHDSLTFAVPMSPFHLLKSGSESSDYCKSGKKPADIPNIHSNGSIRKLTPAGGVFRAVDLPIES